MTGDGIADLVTANQEKYRRPPEPTADPGAGSDDDSADEPQGPPPARLNEARLIVVPGSRAGISMRGAWYRGLDDGFEACATGADHRLRDYCFEQIVVADVTGDRPADVIGLVPYGILNGTSPTVRVGLYVSRGDSLAAPVPVAQEDLGVPSRRPDDGLRAPAAVGDINGDGHADLAVSGFARTERNLGTTRIYLLLGGDAGLSARRARTIEAAAAGIDKPRVYNAFGPPLSLLDHNGDGRADLAVSSGRGPFEVAGVVRVLPSAGTKGHRDIDLPREQGWFGGDRELLS